MVATSRTTSAVLSALASKGTVDIFEILSQYTAAANDDDDGVDDDDDHDGEARVVDEDSQRQEQTHEVLKRPSPK